MDKVGKTKALSPFEESNTFGLELELTDVCFDKGISRPTSSPILSVWRRF